MTTTSTDTATLESQFNISAATSTSRKWLGKGVVAIVDQGLIGTSNFVVGIMLARKVSTTQYGAYAIAFELFLGLSVVYAALVLEPMSVFGASTYRETLREYLGTLLRFHWVTAAVTSFVLGGSAFAAYLLAGPGSALPGSLAGAALAAPCVLLFWLARRAFYVELAPLSAALGAITYFAVLVCGLGLLYVLGKLSPFTTFLLMAIAATAASVPLLARLGPEWGTGHTCTVREVSRRHWNYGRWALGSSLATWAAAGIYYPLLGASRGLADTGSLKALLNIGSPIGQVTAALALLSLPHAASVHHQRSLSDVKRLAQRLFLLYVGGAVVYWIVVLSGRGIVFSALYRGKYTQVAPLLIWVAAASIFRIAGMSQAIILRGIKLPYSVFVAYGASAGVAMLLSPFAVWYFGLRGAVLAPVLVNATGFVVALILVQRSLRQPARV